ncbi:hypothetical protein FRZ44_00370 [Hypericibacter terrae]|uniref:Winged helix-turn-helix domain-containing protein n=1 Tax=Hypericibacter terrae TaxID=2602015 RepID=A0A5J6MC69_9PROT|nr:crosslink repair DNA glycosylase YcaQ family protein [Hypericibacter terrae]QEX14762.1 hypothetical protein FRZ44_00370 [Hypericibacter terrae]
MTKPRPASASELRRFLLDRQGLWGAFWPGAQAPARAVDLAMWQIDSIRITGLRNQEIAWAARSASAPSHFYDLLYGQSALVETHYPIFATRRDWLAHISESLADPATLRSPVTRRLKKVMQEVEDHIRANGPTGPGSFKSRRIVGGFNTIKETTRALEVMFAQRKLVVAGRDKNFQRLFDLTERRLPELVAPPSPRAKDWRKGYDDFLIRSALHVLKLATTEQIAQRTHHHYGPWRPGGGIKRWREHVAHALESGVAIPVQATDLPDQPVYWYLPEDEAGWNAPVANDAPTRLLAPLDHLLYSRPRAKELFDLDYKFEAYTPAHKRRFYFALPVLQGERAVGMVDGKLDGKTWWLRRLELAEDADAEQLGFAIRRFAALAGAEQVGVRARVPQRVKDAIKGKVK